MLVAAQALGLPLVPPFLPDKSKDFSQGVNFAVAGATALDGAFFESRNISVYTNYSLGMQLEWFKQVQPSLCRSPPPSSCQKIFNDSLFLVGEIGGNDINGAFFQRKSVEEIKSIVPKAVEAISSAITRLIEEGAVTLIVPGNLPIGCSSSYLTVFQSGNKDDYDPSTGCLNWLNKFAQFHNDLLQQELNKLRTTHPHANIIYADYYNAAMEMFLSPEKLGFKGGALKACCGGGGPYNYNPGASCSYEGSTVCEDPSTYVNWDGIHLTEAAYKLIATQILSSIKC